MRILQVTPYFEEHYGGTERYCFNLSKVLVERGHEVHVYAARITPKSPRREERAGIKVHRFPTATTIWNINPVTVMLHRLVTNNYDVVHVHSYLYFTSNQALLAKILRSVFRKKTTVVLHLHGGLGIPPYLRSQSLKKVAKHVYDLSIGKVMMRGSDFILSACNSDAKVARRIFGIPNQKVSIVYNAIDTSPFVDSHKIRDEKENPYILYVGDLESWKGVHTIFRAMSVLKKRGLELSLKLAGLGSLESNLRKISDGLKVEFLGALPHSEIPPLMKSAFACVLPSHWEGIPTVGIEALATGTPFIGSNVGGIPELVSHRITGLLVKPNKPRELATAIQELQDSELRQALIKNGRELVNQKFTIESIAQRMEKVYDKIVNH